MPSHVRTRCTVLGPEALVAAFVARHLRAKEGDELSLDFETVVATPAILLETERSERAEAGLFVLTGLLTPFGGGALEYAPESNPSARWGYLAAEVTTRAQLRALLERDDPEAIAHGRRQLAALRAVGCTDWYAWRLAHWGTKGNASSPGPLERSEGRAAFSFDTAWSFPTPIFEALAAAWPALVFDVLACEESLAFGGAGTFNGGAAFALADELATPDLYERVFGTLPGEVAEGW